MRTIAALLTSGLLLLGCIVENTEKDDESGGSGGSSEAGTGGSAAGTGGAGGSTAGSGGAAGAPSDTCDPVGEWSFTMTPSAGDCMTEAFDFTHNVTEADLGADFDSEACELITSEYVELLDETPEEYGLAGELTLQIGFDGDLAIGAAVLAGELTEAGEAVEYCDQEFDIEGSRL